MNLSKLTTWLTLVSLVLGIALGSVALFREFPREPDLVGTICVVPAALPADLSAEQEGLADHIAGNVEHDAGVKRVVSNVDDLRALVAAIKDIVKAELKDPQMQWVKGTHWEQMSVCQIWNRGDKTLYGVKLAGAFASNGQVTIRNSAGEDRIQRYNGPIDIGDLGPQESLLIFEWGIVSRLSFSTQVLTHRDGIGTIRSVELFPSFPLRKRSWWSGTQNIGLIVLAALLVALAILRISAGRFRRRGAAREHV